MAATEYQQLSSGERYALKDALTALNDAADELRLEAIVERSGVDPDAARHVMDRQAADHTLPVVRVRENVWRVEE